MTMHRNPSLSLFCVAFVAITSSLSTSAVALEPLESQRVESVSFSDLYGRTSADATNTLLIGIEGCERAIDANGDITVTYTAANNIDLTLNSAPPIGGYQGTYFFNRDRGSGSSPDCVADMSLCTPLGDSDINRSETQASVSVSFRTLTGLTNVERCVSEPFERDYFIRLQFRDDTTNDQADAKVTLDLIAPEPAEDFEAVVTQDAIDIEWTPGGSGDVESYRVVYRDEQFDGDVFAGEVDGSRSIFLGSNANNTNSGPLRDLVPGSTVWVAIASVDSAGNESILTEAKPFEVIETVGFWEYYKDNGGEEQGGYCNAAPSKRSAPSGALLAALSLLGCFSLHRRRA